MKNKQNTIATVVVILFGLILFYVGTDGFTAFTEETARTNKLIEEKPKFPEVTLEDSLERVYPISDLEGKYVFATFIYTACTDVCLTIETNTAEVYDQIPDEYLGEDIVFLTISFDPERDDPEMLKKYGDYFGSDGDKWRMARINNRQELDHLLDRFGVIVIPDGEGHYAHNAAFYLVNRAGYLIDVMDYEDIDGAAERIIEIIEAEAGDEV